MPCTTLLVGKNASYDGSTMIARTDDGFFDVKKLIVVPPEKQPKKYKSIISHLEIELPDNPLRYTSTPSVDASNGIWAANGVNSEQVAMTATETVTTNARVLGADPLVVYQKHAGPNGKDIPGGIGEEDLVVLTIPYIHSAREGVLRLGSLLETYGTYESNGIAFSDRNEIWWLETIGGHHWIARRVPDDAYVVMPNQFGMDEFDFDDAFGAQKDFLCSSDLREFIHKNHLNLNSDGDFSPRLAFGSHSDADHVYNTPRAWFMLRYFNPNSYIWDGPLADYTPMSDDLPWSMIPEHKITVEEVKYVLSSYYQGTPYNPHGKADPTKKGIYRPIGISRTGVTAILQLRNDVPEEFCALEWLCFGCNAYNAAVPFYTNVDRLPDYISKVTTDVSTENFYWATRLIGAMADPFFGACVQLIERYQGAVAAKSHQLVNEYDAKMTADGIGCMEEANRKLAEMAKKETTKALNQLTLEASKHMKVGYSRADN